MHYDDAATVTQHYTIFRPAVVTCTSAHRLPSVTATNIFQRALVEEFLRLACAVNCPHSGLAPCSRPSLLSLRAAAAAHAPQLQSPKLCAPADTSSAAFPADSAESGAATSPASSAQGSPAQPPQPAQPHQSRQEQRRSRSVSSGSSSNHKQLASSEQAEPSATASRHATQKQNLQQLERDRCYKCVAHAYAHACSLIRTTQL